MAAVPVSGNLCSTCNCRIPEESAGICPVCLLRGVEAAAVVDNRRVLEGKTAAPLYGPYRPVEVLGEGGMGLVYLAEQTEPVRRRVALKVMKHAGVGSLAARFESERQVLALLDHPCIASLYEAGETADGRPWFAMEYVAGISITDYCDTNQLPFRERLLLFEQVCHAVQHAHQHNIIHRDLKPSNILVARKDGGAAVKVIDFGVAKAMDAPLTERRLFTELGVLIGTPEYMSPEQAAGALEMDGATDVYGLGVLLYELLSGATPFDSKQLRRAGYHEICRVIRDTDPPRPSARLQSLGAGATEVARRRGVSVATLLRSLRGDLEWITMKALEKDPKRRYASPSDFAADVQRHLRHQPVTARAPAPLYTLGRFLRRRRFEVTAAAAIFLTVGVSLSALRWSRTPAEPATIRSLAVLPLQNLSGDPAKEYFSDGVTDELITALAKISSAKVISRTSVMRYKGVHNKTLPQIARELGVDAIVQGAVIRTGDRVHLTAQLIDAATDRHLWSDRYERSSRDILIVENEIAGDITAHLRGRLAVPQYERQFAAKEIDSAAHEAYLQGRYLWYRRTPAALEEAIRYFTKAIAKDPRYGLAYAGRSDAYRVLGSWAIEAIEPKQAWAKAKPDVYEAVRLDPASAEAHTALASLLSIYEWDWRNAEIEFKRAIALNPSYAPARQWYGSYLCSMRRFEECLAETARAHSLDPAYLVAAADVGHRLYQAGRFAEAIAPIEKVLEFNSDFIIGHRMLGQVYEANRMYPKALMEFRRANDLSRGAPIELAALGHALAVSGHRGEALAQLRRLDAMAKQRYVSAYGRALILTGLGEQSRALAALEQAFEERSTWMVNLQVDSRLDPLRQDPRFRNLLHKVGFTP